MGTKRGKPTNNMLLRYLRRSCKVRLLARLNGFQLSDSSISRAGTDHAVLGPRILVPYPSRSSAKSPCEGFAVVLDRIGLSVPGHSLSLSSVRNVMRVLIIPCLSKEGTIRQASHLIRFVNKLSPRGAPCRTNLGFSYRRILPKLRDRPAEENMHPKWDVM